MIYVFFGLDSEGIVSSIEYLNTIGDTNSSWTFIDIAAEEALRFKPLVMPINNSKQIAIMGGVKIDDDSISDHQYFDTETLQLHSFRNNDRDPDSESFNFVSIGN